MIHLGEPEPQKPPDPAGRKPLRLDPAVNRVLRHAKMGGHVLYADPAFIGGHTNHLFNTNTYETQRK